MVTSIRVFDVLSDTLYSVREHVQFIAGAVLLAFEGFFAAWRH
jgi:hypothetical protein